MNSSRHLRSLLIAGLVSANCAVFVLSVYSLLQSRHQHELRAQLLTQNIASALDQNVSNSIRKVDIALRTVVDELERQLAGKGFDAAAVNAFLARHEQRLPEIEAFRVADDKGFVIFGKGVNRQDRASWADREYFIFHRDHADGPMQISKPRMGRVAKQYIVGFARRYNHPDGRFAGVVSAPIALDHFTNLLSRFDVGPSGTLILRDADLGLITRSPPIPDQPAGEVGNAGVSKEFRGLVESGAFGATYHTANSPDGFDRTLTFKRLEAAPMIAIVGMASNDYLADWKTEVYKTSALAFGFLSLSVLLGTLLWRSIALTEQHRQQLRAIIESEPECIKIVDAQGRLVQMNPAGLAMIEADSLKQVSMCPVLDVIAPEYRAAFAAMHERVIAGEAMQMEFEVLGLKGGRRLLETHAVPMRDQDKVVHLAVTRDISTRKVYENNLKQAKAAAEAASIAKSQFLATMSHEIRTPMNGILGMAQLLLMPGLSEEERRDYAKTILKSGQTLLTLLNDILDLSKVEAGKLELVNEPMDLEQMLREVADLFVELAQSKGLKIETAWRGPAEPHRYLADPLRLRQMLSNLVSNAIKFTETGCVRLEAVEIERDETKALLEFSVTDSGIGIAQDRLALLFKPFSQVDNSVTRAYGGTGLGLSIVRSLAKLMDGDVGVESGAGAGTRFWFRARVPLVDAPALNPDGTDVAASSHGAPTGVGIARHILVVENHPTNRQVVEALLGKLGCTVTSVANGADAIAAVVHGADPDLMLMEIQMPVLDGLTATREIRRWEKDTGCPRRPIIALSADVFSEDRQNCFDSGMDDFLAKPVDINALVSMLQKWLDEAPRRGQCLADHEKISS